MEHLGAQLGFPLPPAAREPTAAQIANLSGRFELRQLLQRSGQYRVVTLAIVRRAEGAADGMIDERGARRDDFAHDVVRRADDQGRNAARFDDVGDETDGLVAERSIGDEQGEIDARFRELVGQRGSKLALDAFMLAHAAHERIVKRRQGADCAVRSQGSQRRAGKNDLRVPLRHRADARVMIDDDRAAARIGRNAAVAQVFARNERLLIGEPQRGASE